MQNIIKWCILLILFFPIFFLAFRQKKWYLYLLCAFIAVLPEQFSIKLHSSVPLLSATRILILILTGFWLYGKWKTRTFRFPKSLVLFFAINLIISLVNLRFGTQEIKRIFLLIFERVLLVVMLADTITDKEEFHRCIDFAIMGCAALAVIGIVQTVFDYDISTALHLVKTPTSVHLAQRMGLTRAFGTYNAISYGCYCAFMLLLILYRLYSTGSLWHSGAFALTFAALICTYTRSAWLCLAAVVFFLLIFFFKKLCKRLLPGIGMTLAIMILLCCFQPMLFNALVETGKSTINTVLNVIPDPVIDFFTPDAQSTTPSDSVKPQPEDTETEPTKPPVERPGFELDKDFGANAKNPALSRTFQWSAVEYMADEGTLWLGYGYNALLRGKIHFFYASWGNQWTVTSFLDVGLVALITESGILGAIVHLSLLLYMAVYAFRKKRSLKEKELDFNWIVLFMIPLYLLLNYLAAFLNAQIIWVFIGLFYTYQKLGEQKSPTEEALPEQKEEL